MLLKAAVYTKDGLGDGGGRTARRRARALGELAVDADRVFVPLGEEGGLGEERARGLGLGLGSGLGYRVRVG